MTLTTDVYIPMIQDLRELNVTVKRKTARILSEVSNHTLPMAARALRLEAMFNLTNYSSTGSRPRDAAITEAFWLLDHLVGFDYNKSGSFTWKGANDVLKSDAEFRLGKYKLQIIIKGKLAELEEGTANWHNLRKFFFSYGTQTRIKILFPNAYKDIYKRLNKLFQNKRDPTMPRGRPYISQAVQDTSEYMHEAMMHAVERVLPGGDWTHR